jgi:NAD(P)-dependent dehydrogenase (short-subunit alcohol dehydrogenase family)
MDRKTIYFTAAGIGAGLMVQSVLRRRVGEGFYRKVVLITGAARGLGRSVACEFAAEGCRLALCDHDAFELDLARQELEGRGAHVFTVRCDVTNPAQVEGMTEAVLDHYGVVEILVNNASPPPAGAAQKTGFEDFEQAMENTFWGVVYPTRAVLPNMLEHGAGRIVNMMSGGGSLAATHPLPRDCARFAAIGFSEELRSELRRKNITVNTVASNALSPDESRAARQILTAIEREEANGLSAGAPSRVLRLLSEALDGKNQSSTIVSALAMLGRLATRRHP